MKIMENNQEQEKNYVLSTEFKELLYNNLFQKPYQEVYTALNFLNTDKSGEIGEIELNNIVNYLAKLPYDKVAHFFQTLPSMLVKVNNNAPDEANPETEVKSQVKPKQVKKQVKKPVEKPVEKVEDFEESLIGDLDKFV